MSYLQYLPFDEDPYDDMDWFAENPEFPVNQCYDPRTMCNTINCCPTTDLCEEIGIDQEPKIGNDGFTVSLDVSQFKPDEITVDTENNLIVVHARQEEKTNGKGYMSREFVRTYELPPQFKPEDVIAILSCDGILQIKAPNIKYRSVRIQQTGPLRMCLIENIKSCDDDGKDDKNNKGNSGNGKDDGKNDDKNNNNTDKK